MFSTEVVPAGQDANAPFSWHYAVFVSLFTQNRLTSPRHAEQVRGPEYRRAAFEPNTKSEASRDVDNRFIIVEVMLKRI